MEDVKVFGLWASPFTQRVVWALKLKGVSYEYIGEDLANKSNLLLQHNPIYKKVPVLVHNGRAIAESMIILEYIDETWPQTPLLPQDVYHRSNVRFWSKFIDQKTVDMMKFFGYDGEVQERAMKETLETLRVIEKESGLAENKFMGGNTIGLADLALGWVAHTLVAMGYVIGVKFITPHAFPNLHSWMANFLQIPLIKHNLPPHHLAIQYFTQKREMFLAMIKQEVTHHYHHHHHNHHHH
ncbi:glutathione S-transferase U7 [Cajanus cajan]|uniref:glutathione transferase n=1 Tax=Cajanus cajan TaxID=3821 RepID=A0A151T0Z2_CAJCA|nr:glutathione S-transferase U7 [Cajanus cajan]KYP60723.1 putative glutathione S-transferase [Cajanus cajan]